MKIFKIILLKTIKINRKSFEVRLSLIFCYFATIVIAAIKLKKMFNLSFYVKVFFLPLYVRAVCFIASYAALLTLLMSFDFITKFSK